MNKEDGETYKALVGEVSDIWGQIESIADKENKKEKNNNGQ
jgi:hypothetical protein